MNVKCCGVHAVLVMKYFSMCSGFYYIDSNFRARWPILWKCKTVDVGSN